MAVARCERFDRARLASVVLGSSDDEREHDQHRGNQPQIACAGTDLVFEEEPEDADRDGADDDVPAHPVIEIAPVLGIEHTLGTRQ